MTDQFIPIASAARTLAAKRGILERSAQAMLTNAQIQAREKLVIGAARIDGRNVTTISQKSFDAWLSRDNCGRRKAGRPRNVVKEQRP